MAERPCFRPRFPEIGFGLLVARSWCQIDLMVGRRYQQLKGPGGMPSSQKKKWPLLGINQLIIGIALVFGLGLGAALLRITETQHFEALDQLGNERLDLYVSTVQSAHRRFDYLPFIVSGDLEVKALLEGTGSIDVVNRKLESWQKESNAADLYLMNYKGVVLAASNWHSTDSFIGHDYHFRPYFQDAIAGRRGQFFAVGVTTGRPGFFLSRPVMLDGEIQGAAVVKIDMTQLERDWMSGGEHIWVADSDGVIFLASDPALRYRSLDTLDESILARLEIEKKYSANVVRPLPLIAQEDTPQGKRIIQLAAEPDAGSGSGAGGARRYMMHSRFIEGLDWTLYYLTDLQGLVENKRKALLISGLTTALVALLALFLASRIRNRQLLEQRVASRTKALNESNRRLLDEFSERSKAEEQLRQTHEGLIQAEKLAALGQLSAGLVHEINQPLSAMQTFIASTRLFIERKDTDNALSNLDDIKSMVRRVTAIVSHLKTFARKSQGHTTNVALNRVIENALLILNPRLSKSAVVLEWSPPQLPMYVKADEIKLEQIFVNLIRNALDAMRDCGDPAQNRLEIEIELMAGRTIAYIKDTGCGINPDDLPKVFDPFFTTKDAGEGLGLGLSVSHGIAREFGGDLEAMDRPSGGTIFKLSLETAEASGVNDDR